MADIGANKTYRYDIRPDGSLANKALFCGLGSDGMTLDDAGNVYLTGKGVVAIGADTWGLEVIPFESKNVFEVHQILLPMNGTYILENMNTADLAKDKAYEFMFVLGQPRFKGGVQSMINPVAIR